MAAERWLGTPCTVAHLSTISERLSFILSVIGSNRCLRMLDVGTGLGVYIQPLMPYCSLYMATDINRLNLERVRKNEANAELGVVAAERLPFADGSFDIVLLIEVLEHVVDDRSVLSEVHRVLRPDGKFIFTLPNKLFPFEMHALKGSNGIFGFKYGVPFLPYLPESIRNRITTARVYRLKDVSKIIESQFSIEAVRYFLPDLDGSKPMIRNLVRRFQAVAEHELLRWFLPHIMVSSRRL